jgi:hypothetical protein
VTADVGQQQVVAAGGEPPRADTDIDAMVAAEIKRLREAGQLEVRTEHRCRVCKDEPTRMLINNLLARMMSYRDIYTIINASINPVRKQRNERPITQRIIGHHAKEHFAIDNPAWAIFRNIGVRRGRQMGKDYEDGIAETVSHLAFLEAVVQKGWVNLIQPTTEVPYSDGLNAAVKLAEIEAKTAGAQQHAEMLAQVNRIITIFKESVPPEEWPAIVARIQGDELPQSASVPAIAQRVMVRAADADDEEFDPGEDNDFDDEDGE